MLTIQDAAKLALQCQDACNLSGIAISFADVMRAVCEEATRLNKGTRWKNEHPITTLFLSKMSELNGCGSTLNEQFDIAQAACEILASGGSIDCDRENLKAEIKP